MNQSSKVLIRGRNASVQRFDLERCSIDKTIDFDPSEDSVTMAAAALDANQSHIWELFGYEIITQKAGFDKASIKKLAYLPKRNWLVSGDSEGKIQIFSLSPIQRIAQIDAHEGYSNQSNIR